MPEKKPSESNTNISWKQLTFALCIAALVFVAAWHISAVLNILKAFMGFFSTVIIGIVIAYVLNPLVTWIQNHIFSKMRNRAIARNVSVVSAFLFVILFFTLLLIALIPQLVKSLMNFVSNIDVYVEGLRSIIAALTANSGSGEDSVVNLDGIISMGDNILSNIATFFSENSQTIIKHSVGIGSAIANFVIANFIAVYLLVDTERITWGIDRFFRVFFSDKYYRNFSGFWKRCNSIMARYIVFDIIDGIFVGVVNAVFMLIAGYPYIVLVSVVVGITNLAPTFGPIVGGVIGAFILLLVNPWYALGFLVFTFALQTFDGYVFKPKLFGNTLGVPSIMILISIVVFGRMFGVIGILMAIPLAAIIDYAYKEWLMPRLRERKERMDSGENPSD